MNETPFLNTEQAAQIIGVHPSTLSNWLLYGPAKGQRIGRFWAITQAEAERLKKWHATKTRARPFTITPRKPKPKPKPVKITGSAKTAPPDPAVTPEAQAYDPKKALHSRARPRRAGG